MYRARVYKAWANENYSKLEKWIEDNHAWWDLNGGISHIDGKTYPATLCFINEEDMLMCKLSFSDMVIQTWKL